MIDEQEGQPRGDPDGDHYLYDFFKYLTSVALLSMGALFTFLGMDTAKGVPDLLKAAAAVVLGLAAFLAFYGAEQLVAAKSRGESVGPAVYRLRKWAPQVYLVGFAILAYICGDIIH
ncbi:MAG TPA: hypothetical protein VF718_14130 [Allosphingosinicella sp.]|jgi:hypothetical protein